MHSRRGSPYSFMLFFPLLAACGGIASPADNASAHVSVDRWDVYYDEVSGEIEGSVSLSVENTGSVPIYLDMYGSAPWQQLQAGDEWVTVYIPFSVAASRFVPIQPGQKRSKELNFGVRPGDPNEAPLWQSPVPGPYRLLVNVVRKDSEDAYHPLDGPIASEPVQLEPW